MLLRGRGTQGMTDPPSVPALPRPAPSLVSPGDGDAFQGEEPDSFCASLEEGRHPGLEGLARRRSGALRGRQG